MHVILDSTALIGDFKLESSPMRSLLEASKTKTLDVVVPEVVLLEVTNKWNSKVDELTKRFHKAAKDARQLGLEMDSAEFPLHGSSPDTYEAMLRTMLAEHAVAIEEIPDVPHVDLVRKAVRRQAPFNEKGAGYRDALIWETVKETLRTTTQGVTFVTRNSSDFGGSERDGIKQSLVDELVREGLEPDRLTIVETPSGAAAMLDQTQDLLEQFNEKLKSDDAFTERLFEQLTASVDLNLSGGPERSFVREWRFLEVHAMHPLSHFKPFRSWPVAGERIGIEFEAEADVEVDVEYEEDDGLFLYDSPDHLPIRLFRHRGTATVTALFGGELEYDARTASFSAVAMRLDTLSEPDPRQ